MSNDPWIIVIAVDAKKHPRRYGKVAALFASVIKKTDGVESDLIKRLINASVLKHALGNVFTTSPRAKESLLNSLLKDMETELDEIEGASVSMPSVKVQPVQDFSQTTSSMYEDMIRSDRPSLGVSLDFPGNDFTSSTILISRKISFKKTEKANGRKERERSRREIKPKIPKRSYRFNQPKRRGGKRDVFRVPHIEKPR